MKENKFFEIFILGLVTLGLNLFFTWIIGTKSLLLLMIVLTFVAPMIAIITAKHDEVNAIAVAAIVFGATWSAFSLPIALVGFISYGILGMLVGYAFRNEFNLKQTVGLSGLAYALEFILLNFIAIRFYNINIIKEVFINGMVIPFMNVAMKFSKDNQEEIVLLVNSLLINIPAVITVASFVLGFIVVIISLFITRKAGYNVNSIEPFSEFQLPISMVWISIAAQILALGSGAGSSVDNFVMVLINFSYMFNFLFMVQGMALADFFLKEWGLRGTLRIIVYVIGGIFVVPFIFIPLIQFVLTIVGVLDVLMNFRKLKAKS